MPHWTLRTRFFGLGSKPPLSREILLKASATLLLEGGAAPAGARSRNRPRVQEEESDLGKRARPDVRAPARQPARSRALAPTRPLTRQPALPGSLAMS